ncbi:hypothetical protein CEUSTIGMA_g5871.t1 [Chlamydomonas eustigma]|uniref:Uncharacterized protein n=1 Tax=Chlamydomonas eustigma TaxID=1157962 RepID=A0A250X6N9_9CHLO|nr:hypothetical protein CEUSTIGMA_g5871.t1 [Chlamydomonas eustigma]|eukprot:GAX78430.1 hypothetical protein CEUSTIGMA_g5871.t1 [Chlamydomonas eustigma]
MAVPLQWGFTNTSSAPPTQRVPRQIGLPIFMQQAGNRVISHLRHEGSAVCLLTRVKSCTLAPTDEPVHQRSSLPPSNSKEITGVKPYMVLKLLAPPSEKMLTVLGKVEGWQFDSFELDNVSSCMPLSMLGFYLFKKMRLLRSFHLDETKLARSLPMSFQHPQRCCPISRQTWQCGRMWNLPISVVLLSRDWIMHEDCFTWKTEWWTTNAQGTINE